MNLFGLGLLAGILVFSGCGKDESKNSRENDMNPMPELKTSVVGNSSSCKEPPTIINWSGTAYEVKDINSSLEPGMKFGFVQCKNGAFTLGEGGPGTYVVYSSGDPRTNRDFLFFGAWGRALYTKQTADEPKPSIIQESFSLPSGYRQLETTSYTIAIPNDWQWSKGDRSDSLSFAKEGEKLGETEILAWFDSDETWRTIKPNHSEQTHFQKVEALASIEGVDAELYKIQLTHTKPAAAEDPEWTYEETRWYVAVKENSRSYGFYFSSEQVDEPTMKTILSSFRLK